MNWPRLLTAGGLCLLFAPAPPRTIKAHPLLVDDPTTLMALEDEGFAFTRVVSSEAFATIEQTITSDIDALKRAEVPDDRRRLFEPKWLARGRFELIGIVNRIDRRAFDTKTCGEVRFVYRLALKNKKRPTARLPMTVNVRVPQLGDCAAIATRWSAGTDLSAILRALPRYEKIEINLQSVHVPATQTDMDDHAEYILRAFARRGDGVVPDTLFNTPREDLSPAERNELRAWAGDNQRAIEEGSAVVPDRFLATRVVSFSPRGLARAENAVFSRVLGRDAFGELAMRRLDEMACPGCHQTTGVAGFHLLGQERDAAGSAAGGLSSPSDQGARMDSLAIGRSPHLARDLPWRADDLAAATKGGFTRPRPFAAHSEGGLGEECGLSPGLAVWRCKDGLVCRNVHGASIGICARPAGAGPGEPCEDVRSAPSDRPVGAIVTASPADATCPAPSGDLTDGPFCAPNWLGFTGGMCSQRCSVPGEIRGQTVCARLPAAGYEADCLYSREPIERCLERHLISAFVALCDKDHPCRGDYACAAVKGAPAGSGACVPPYFLFQARVDGPLLDR